MLQMFMILLRFGVTALGVTEIVSLSSAIESSLDLSSFWWEEEEEATELEL